MYYVKEQQESSGTGLGIVEMLIGSKLFGGKKKKKKPGIVPAAPDTSEIDAARLAQESRKSSETKLLIAGIAIFAVVGLSFYGAAKYGKKRSTDLETPGV